MGLSRLIFLFSCMSLGFAGSWDHIANKEIVFNYKALVRAGTVSPDTFASEFLLEGKIHAQAESNTSVVRLSDLTYRMYNGYRYSGHEQNTKPLPLPEGTECLVKPFKIQYETSGQVLGIVTEENEKEYSRNIKRAIAAILQLDFEHIELDKPRSHAFTTLENSIYGRHLTSYNVLPLNKKILVQKMHEMQSTQHMYHHVITNIIPSQCEAQFEEPMSHDSQQFYFFVEHDGMPFVDYIESNGGTYFYPLKGQSDAQYVFVNQTLKFVDIQPIQEPLTIASPKYTAGLAYVLYDADAEYSTLPDYLGGRRNWNSEKTIPIFSKLLEEVVDYLDQHHVHMKQPAIKQGQLINRIVGFTPLLDLKTLDDIYNSLISKKGERDLKVLETFYEFLPIFGTRASVTFIKTLITEKKIDDALAIRIIQDIPFYIKLPNEEILDELDHLTNAENLNWTVRRTALYALSTYIRKLYEKQKTVWYNSHQHNYSSEHEHTTKQVNLVPQEWKQFFTDHKFYEKYVLNWVSKLKAGKNYDEQSTYLKVLFNTRLEIIFDHLLPYVTGKDTDDVNLRYQALWVIFPLVAGNSQKVFEIYWPIYSDYSQPLLLRINAYHILVESQPTISRLLNIYWHMQTEPSPEIYHYHYTLLQSWAKTTDPCRQVFRTHIAQILKFTRKPNVRAHSFAYVADYLNKKFGFGGGIINYYQDLGDTKVVGVELKSQLFNIPTNSYSLFFKISGLDVPKNIQLNLDTNTQLFNLDELWNVIWQIATIKNIIIEYDILYYNQVVSSYVLDTSNIGDEHFSFIKPEFSLIKKYVRIHYDVLTLVTRPTDLGIPILAEILAPTVNDDKINVVKDIVNKVTNLRVDNHYKLWKHARAGLSFYNPITDVFQGINRFISFDADLPINLDLSLNWQQKSLKISWKRHEDDLKDLIGLKSHVTSMVFVKDDLEHNVLQKSCLNCINWAVTSRSEGLRHNFTIAHNEWYNSGHNYLSAIYDSDQYISNGSVTSLWATIMDIRGQNYWLPSQAAYIACNHMYRFLTLQPYPGTYGSIWRLLPSREHPVTQVDLFFRINSDISREQGHYLPAVKLNPRFTFSIKNKGKTLKTWDLNAILDWKAGHVFKNIKAQFTRIIPGENDFKICLDATKKWTDDGVSGHATIGMSHSAESKCSAEETIVDLDGAGVQLDEQKGIYHTYGICQPYAHFLPNDYHSLYCSAAHTSIRKYTWDIRTRNIPTEFRNTVQQWFDHITKGHFHVFYQHKEEHKFHINENDLKITAEYALVENEAKLSLYTQHNAYILSGLPRIPFEWLSTTDNTRFSHLYLFMHSIGWVQSWRITHDSITREQNVVFYQIPNEWTHLFGDSEQNGVFVKLVENDILAMKVVNGNDIFEVIPDGPNLNPFENGKSVLDLIDFYDGRWFSYMVRPQTHSVVVVLHNYQVVVEYDAHNVYLEVPNIRGVQFYGKCITV